MTIKEFARKQGITPQAVYQKIKAAGLDVSSLREENTAQLTAEGLEAVKALFIKNSDNSGRKVADLLTKIAALEVENKSLKEKIAELRGERDKWADAAEAANKVAGTMQEALLRAQAINMASLQAAASAPRLSLWQRITGRRLKAAEQPEKAAAEAAQEAEKA